MQELFGRIKRSIHTYYVLYADSTELLDKAQKMLRPLPDGCKFVKLTYENKNLYQCAIGDIDKVVQFGEDAWAVVTNNEIIAYQMGTYRNKQSLFFNVKNCDFEHIEIITDKNYRRQGIALNLIYHMARHLNFNDLNHKKIGTVIEPKNTASIKLHELIGFKVSHRIVFFSCRRKKGERWSFINIPRYTI